MERIASHHIALYHIASNPTGPDQALPLSTMNGTTIMQSHCIKVHLTEPDGAEQNQNTLQRAESNQPEL